MTRGGKRPGAGRPSNERSMIESEVEATVSLAERDRLILSACKAAANVLLRHGLQPADIANGMISYGGAVALELTGAKMTAAVFQSKADALRGQITN